MGSSQKFLIFLLSWVKFLRQWGLYFPYCTAGKGLFFPFVKNCSYINSVCKKELRHLLHSLKVEQTRYGRILSKTIQNKKWNHGGQTTGWRKMVWMTPHGSLDDIFCTLHSSRFTWFQQNTVHYIYQSTTTTSRHRGSLGRAGPVTKDSEEEAEVIMGECHDPGINQYQSGERAVCYFWSI